MRTLTALLNSLPQEIREPLQAELTRLGKQVATDAVSASISRILVKAIDGAAAAAVKALPAEKHQEFIEAYYDSVWEEIEEAGHAIEDYIPLQIQVESAKKEFGKKSEEANKARRRRTIGLSHLRAELKDIILAASGSTPGS